MLKILPLGDSITEGSEEFPGGYRGPLQQLLTENDVNFDFVGTRTHNSYRLDFPAHEGHPGFRTAMLGIGARTEHSHANPIKLTLKTFAPDIVLLMSGTNNLYFDEPDSALAEMRTLITEILNRPNAPTIALGTILPIIPGEKPWNMVIPNDVADRVMLYNEGLVDLARSFRESGEAVDSVDIFSCLDSLEELHPDGVHPREVVMRRMADAWFHGIQRIL